MRILTILFVLVLFSGCKASSSELFSEKTISVGDKTLYVQIAESLLAREQGLMNRKDTKPFDGMLFIFPDSRQASFWMKDTSIPLEIGYFDSKGILVEIHPMTPFSTQQILSLSYDILYALELPYGDFDRQGITIGQKLFIP